MMALLVGLASCVYPSVTQASAVTLEAPASVKRFEPAEFVVRVAQPSFTNPFTEAELTGTFSTANETTVTVGGFCDSQDGRVFRLRFCPAAARVSYTYEITLTGGGLERKFKGTLKCEPSEGPGPVIADPQHPKHFIYAGSGRPFYHLGYTAYHLLDPTNSDEQVAALVAYCAEQGFNKIRFLLAGYPRDGDNRTSHDNEHGVPDPWKAPNYGAKPHEVNALPAWLGEPHHYDFNRFNVAYWQKVDRAVQRMREAGIVATCIFTIEKQDLPREYGALTAAEYLLYRYAIDRLAAFDNVWWDLGNEHNEFRDAAWAEAMGKFVKQRDPCDRLASVHGYEEFRYPASAWADFIIVQQYGDEKAVHDWAMKYRDVPKPFVNEEYGYEGEGRRAKGKPAPNGHGQNADAARRSHWVIAMAGGYATYGDWAGGVSYFYMGEPGPGVAAKQLKYLRRFFEALPFRELAPRDGFTADGFCLAHPPDHYVFYFPRGGERKVDLSTMAGGKPAARWFDPRTGRWQDAPKLRAGDNVVVTPDGGDWVLSVTVVPSSGSEG